MFLFEHNPEPFYHVLYVFYMSMLSHDILLFIVYIRTWSSTNILYPTLPGICRTYKIFPNEASWCHLMYSSAVFNNDQSTTWVKKEAEIEARKSVQKGNKRIIELTVILICNSNVQAYHVQIASNLIN